MSGCARKVVWEICGRKISRETSIHGDDEPEFHPHRGKVIALDISMHLPKRRKQYDEAIKNYLNPLFS